MLPDIRASRRCVGTEVCMSEFQATVIIMLVIDELIGRRYLNSDR